MGPVGCTMPRSTTRSSGGIARELCIRWLMQFESDGDAPNCAFQYDRQEEDVSSSCAFPASSRDSSGRGSAVLEDTIDNGRNCWRYEGMASPAVTAVLPNTTSNAKRYCCASSTQSRSADSSETAWEQARVSSSKIQNFLQQSFMREKKLARQKIYLFATAVLEEEHAVFAEASRKLQRALSMTVDQLWGIQVAEGCLHRPSERRRKRVKRDFQIYAEGNHHSYSIGKRRCARDG